MGTSLQKPIATKDLFCIPHLALGPQQCPTEELSSLSFKVFRQKLVSTSWRWLASRFHRSCSTTWFWIFTIGSPRGILRLFFLFLGTQCHMPDTWCLARKPVPLGKGVGHTVNKEHKKVPSVPPHTSTHTSPQWKNAGVWKQWEPMSHGGRQDNASPKRLCITMSGGADVRSWQTVTSGMTLSSGQSLALPWMTWVFSLTLVIQLFNIYKHI